MAEFNEQEIDERLGIVNGRIKSYKKNPSDTIYYRLHIKPYFEKKCKMCAGKLTRDLVCEKCGQKHNKIEDKEEFIIGILRKGYAQETYNEETGMVSPGSKGLPKILYNKDKVEQAKTIVYCMTENDCDFLNSLGRDFVATTSIGAPKIKLAPYLWKYYIEDLKNKDVVFIARSDAEEKHFLILIRDSVLSVANKVSLIPIRKTGEQFLGISGRKIKIRNWFREKDELYREFQNLIRESKWSLHGPLIEMMLRDINEKVIPEEYIDGFKDIVLLKAEVEGEIKKEKLKEEREHQRIEKEAKKYDMDKKRAKEISKRREDFELLERIKTIIGGNFPDGKKVWLISNKSFSEILKEKGVTVSPEKLSRLLGDDTICIKKTKSRGRVNLHLVKPKG